MLRVPKKDLTKGQKKRTAPWTSRGCSTLSSGGRGVFVSGQPAPRQVRWTIGGLVKAAVLSIFFVHHLTGNLEAVLDTVENVGQTLSQADARGSVRTDAHGRSRERPYRRSRERPYGRFGKHPYACLRERSHGVHVTAPAGVRNINCLLLLMKSLKKH